MSSLPAHASAQPIAIGSSLPLPQTFAETIAQVKTWVLETFDREIVEKQLCYHTRNHVDNVQRRAQQIFQTIRPELDRQEDSHRLELLIDLCAIAHDMIQIFTPPLEPHAPRRREAGVSEEATLKLLFDYIQTLNQSLQHAQMTTFAGFTDTDWQIIQAAITATVCDYDVVEQAIFQPALYDSGQPLSLIARTIALADIGALGMDGIDAYNAEGRLLFLEENPDVRSLIEAHQIHETNNPILQENIRQRLLRRARFQVNFARSRLKRLPQELEGLSAVAQLTHEVFQYLTPETIHRIEATTPTAEETSFADLLCFFQFSED